jgi:hypothetical protein
MDQIRGTGTRRDFLAVAVWARVWAVVVAFIELSRLPECLLDRWRPMTLTVSPLHR